MDGIGCRWTLWAGHGNPPGLKTVAQPLRNYPRKVLLRKVQGRSHHQHPLVRRAAAPGERGTHEAQPRFALSHQTREIRVVPLLMRRFGKVSNHNGEGAPSEREALWLSKVCTIQVNNLVSVEYSPIRRHLLDPQRRKSSTHPAPAEFAVAFNGGPNRHQQWLAGGPPLLSWPPEYGRSFPSKKSGAVQSVDRTRRTRVAAKLSISYFVLYVWLDF